MKFLILLFLLFLNLPAIEDRQALMETISQHAIRIGNGPNRVYAFIDPLCSRSQSYIELISTRKDLQDKSSYYIFLNELQKFDSKEFIAHVYQSEDPLSALLDIIIYSDYDIEFQETTEKASSIIEKINKVAKQMEIKRRPYLLMFDEGSKYCKVSEGTAPCLEENDFD